MTPPPSIDVTILVEFAEIELAALGRYFVPADFAELAHEAVAILRQRHPASTIDIADADGVRVIRSPDHLGRATPA